MHVSQGTALCIGATDLAANVLIVLSSCRQSLYHALCPWCYQRTGADDPPLCLSLVPGPMQLCETPGFPLRMPSNLPASAASGSNDDGSASGAGDGSSGSSMLTLSCSAAAFGAWLGSAAFSSRTPFKPGALEAAQAEQLLAAHSSSMRQCQQAYQMVAMLEASRPNLVSWTLMGLQAYVGSDRGRLHHSITWRWCGILMVCCSAGLRQSQHGPKPCSGSVQGCHCMQVNTECWCASMTFPRSPKPQLHPHHTHPSP
jgi:hypothetical protein